MQRKVKKHNNQTGGYKIDIYDSGGYICSTDWSKTCKQAVERYKERNPKQAENKIFGRFDYQIISF
jgi:hypothetical protein